MFGRSTLQAYLVVAALGLIGVLVAIVMARKPEISALIVGGLVALIVPVPLIWLMRRLGYPIGRPMSCARCGAEQPVMRRPASFRQAMLGGVTCAQCGAELDARGRLRTPTG